MAVTVTGINRVPFLSANKRGDVALAFVDFTTGGFAVAGAILARLHTGNLSVWMPLYENQKGRRRAVTITDKDLRNEVITLACNAYLAIGGSPDDVAGREIHEDVEEAEDADGVRRFLGAR